MYYLHQNSNYLKSIILLIFFNNFLFAEEYLTGTLMKMLNDGTREKFFWENLYLKNTSKKIQATADKKTAEFSFLYSDLPKVGQSIQLELGHKKDWFILSPLNGYMSVPAENNNKIDVLVISKTSKMYLELSTKVVGYTIQVLNTKDKNKAQGKVNDLRKYCQTTKNMNKKIKNKFNGKYYCKKYVDYITELKEGMPNKFIFKVHYNIYRSKKDAKKDLKIIRSFKSCKDAWIKPLVKMKED